MEKDENNNTARTFLVYLYMMKMNETMDYFAENTEELDMKTKFSYANILLEIGKFEQATKIYDSLNEAAPKWSCPWRHKGEAQYKVGKMEKAEQAFLKAIETRKEHYDAYVWLAKAQKEMGKYKVALKTLETGLTYKGKDIEDPEKEVATSEVEALHQELIELTK